MTRKRISRRAVAAVAGLAFVAAGTTAVVASGNQVWTNPPYGSGYQFPPASYDVSGGPASVTFSYTLKDLTTTAISASAPLNVSRIISVELSGVWTDVSTGYPSLTDSQIAQAAGSGQTDQIFNVVTLSTAVTVPASGSVPVTFTFQVSECGYYQIDSQVTSVSGWFVTGFIRVTGCTPAPSPSPSPSTSPSPSPSTSPSPDGPSPSPSTSPSPDGPSPSPSPSSSEPSSPSPSPSPTGGVQAATSTPTPTGGVGAASTPATGAATGPGGGLLGLGLIAIGALLLLGATLGRRRPQAI